MGTDCSIAIKKTSGEITEVSLDRLYIFSNESGYKRKKWYSDVVFLGIISVSVSEALEESDEDEQFKTQYLDYYLHWLNEAALIIKNNPGCEFAIITDDDEIENIV